MNMHEKVIMDISFASNQRDPGMSLPSAPKRISPLILLVDICYKYTLVLVVIGAFACRRI